MGRFLIALALAACQQAPVQKAAAAGDYVFPALSGRVVDAAGLLDVEEEGRLDAVLRAAEARTKHQTVIVTVPSLGGHRIEDYGLALGRRWGIGRKDVNDGVVFLIAPSEHQARIEVGYGLEGVLSDEEAARIMRDEVTPRFAANDFKGGIEAGTAAILREIDVPGATP